MKNLIALAAALLILTACTTPSPARLPDPEPMVIDARICAQPEAEPAPRGTIIAPETLQEAESVQAHLESDSDARQWGRRGWQIVAIARTMCAR